MKPPPEEVPIQIGKYRTMLPVYYEDRATSARIAAQVEACVRAVEDNSETIDTVAFVLGAAYEFAWEAHLLKEEQREQNAELNQRLKETLGQITKLLKTYTPPEGD